MSQWPSAKAKRVLSALLRLGWETRRQTGSHRTLMRKGWNDFVFAFHDGEEVGPRMLARIAKHTPRQRSARISQSRWCGPPGASTSWPSTAGSG